MTEKPMVAISQLGFPDTSFGEDIAIATRVGIAGISPDENKIAEGTESELADKMITAGVATALGTPSTLTILPVLEPGMPPGSPDPDERVASIVAALGKLAPFDPVGILFITGPIGDLDEREARARIVDGTRTLASEAKKLGLRMSIEPMREANRPRWTIICSLAETLDLLDEVGDDDIGIVFDTWHLWDSENVHEMIPTAADRIHGVQIADYRDPTRSSMDRVVAGDGIAGIDLLVAELRNAGYQGWYELEIFSDDGRFGNEFPDSLWKLDPVDYAQRQLDGFMRCWPG
jgi:sugar phosphate isomerase/epimerase